MTHSVSFVQDWLGAAISSILTLWIDIWQALAFVSLNLFDGFRNMRENSFKKPFDIHTLRQIPPLCRGNADEGLCDGAFNKECIAWYYDGDDSQIRDSFYQQQEYWCGSLVIEPIIMRVDHIVQTFGNFLQRATTGSFRTTLAWGKHNLKQFS